MWNWITYPAIAWVLLTAGDAWWVFGRRPISESQIKREIGRQVGLRRWLLPVCTDPMTAAEAAYVGALRGGSDMAAAILRVLAVLFLALSIAIVYVLGIRSKSSAVRNAARRLSRCGRDEGSRADRDAARHTAHGDRRRAHRRDRVPAQREPFLTAVLVTPPLTGRRDASPKRGRPSPPRGRPYVATCLPLAVGTTLTSGPGTESEP